LTRKFTFRRFQTKIASIAILSVLALSPALSAAVFAATSSGSGTYTGPALPDLPLHSTAIYAVSGGYTYQAAGAAMRDQGYGTITITWSGTLVKAYLIWAVMDDCSNPEVAGPTCTAPANSVDDAGTINGVAITGTFQGTDYSPCWGPSNIFVYAADVTSDVSNGANSLTKFPSGVTDGSDPWSSANLAAQPTPMLDGASLVVVSTGATLNQIYVYTGTYTEPAEGNPISSTFNHGAADATTATTTFIVADGQLSGNFAVWNGGTIDSNAFPGSDPKATATAWSEGNLWDTKTYSVPETLGATSDTVAIGSESGDCLTQAGQVIMIPSTAPILGTPQFGMSGVLVGAMMAVALLALRPALLRKFSPKV